MHLARSPVSVDAWGEHRRLGRCRSDYWILHYKATEVGHGTKLTWDSAYDIPQGYYVSYCYDNLNRMTVAMENSTDPNCNTSKLATYTYDTLSRRKRVDYLNGANMAYTYSPAGDLLSLDEAISGAGPHYDFTYTDAHQLASETQVKPSYVWQPSTTGTDTYTAANNLNQYPGVHFAGGPPLPSPFGYDQKGNLTSGNLLGTGNWTLSYDPENRLLTANNAGGTVAASYDYDPLGRRTHKSGTGVTEAYYLNDGDDEIVEYDSGKNPIALYVAGPAIDEPIAMVMKDGSGHFTVHKYFHTNRQGSVVAMSGDGGLLAEGPYTYDPYGDCFSGANPCSTGEPYRFTGRRLDPETGCYYYRACYYCADDKRGGRFLQTDPVGYTADLNPYTYVGNNPIDRTDPTGDCTRVDARRCGDFGDLEGANATYSGIGSTANTSYTPDIGSLASTISTPAPQVAIAAAGIVVAANNPPPPIGPKSRSAPPEPLPGTESRPHTDIRGMYDQKGNYRGKEGSYTTHENGQIKQYRGSGKAHGSVARPNVKQSETHTNPKTGQSYQKMGSPRPATPEEIPGTPPAPGDVPMLPEDVPIVIPE